MSNSAFTPTVLTISSGTGSGSGEKNYITNPSMASATTGWNVVGDFTLTRTTAASELPREYTTATGIKLVATSGTQSTADYMYFDFNLDDVDLGRKLKIQWSQKKIGTYSAGQLAVVITSQADRTTALITPQTTAIPASDLDFVTSFDSTTTAALSLVIRATADMTTGDGICISDVVVGPGTITQGAVVGEWLSYTPSLGGISAQAGTATGRYRRVGNSMEIDARFVASGAATGVISVGLPAGVTIDSTQITNSGVDAQIFGSAHATKTGVGYHIGAVTYASSTSFRFTDDDGATNYTTNTPFVWANNDALSFFATVPIAEWAGSGTVNLGAGAQVEYVSHDGTNIVRGPNGSVIPTTTPSSTAERLDITTGFQYSIQNDDILTMEVQVGGVGPWFPIPATVDLEILQFDGTNYVGLCLETLNSVIYMSRGKYRRRAGATSELWSGLTANTRWRIKKAKASSPVGFGLADSNNSGLIKPRKGQVALTFSASTPAATPVRAIGIYYQDQDGNHRLKFNINYTVASGARTSSSITLTNVTFKNVASYYQAVAGCSDAANGSAGSYAQANSGVIYTSHASATTTQYFISGDVELESKPTWA